MESKKEAKIKDYERTQKEKRLIKDEHTRSIFNKVFDRATLKAVREIARKKYFEEVEFVISTGKEGHVFRCNSKENYYALKIYKIETSNFNHMNDYIMGDERFKEIRKDKLEIVKTWAKKEFRNLEEFTKAKIRVPLPITTNRNCILMEFIGIDGTAAPRAKEKPFKNMTEKYELMCEYMAKMVNAKLIHADLSEYNILNNDEEMVIIDVGQAVSTMHPNAKEFFERDVLNMAKWFAKHGIQTNPEKMYLNIKQKSAELNDLGSK